MRVTSRFSFMVMLAVGVSLTACDEAPTSPEGMIPVETGASAVDHLLRGQVSVLDGVRDNTGPIDVRGMVLNFDPSTGNYEIQLWAHAHAPFIGDFRVNVNLFNETAGSFFSDTFNDFSLSSPQQELLLRGSNPLLTGWSRGDVVHTNSLSGQPEPPGVSPFRTQVTTFPLGFLTNEDVVEAEPAGTPSIVTSR